VQRFHATKKVGHPSPVELQDLVEEEAVSKIQVLSTKVPIHFVKDPKEPWSPIALWSLIQTDSPTKFKDKGRELIY
jgi:hypothetical protein